MTKLTDRQILQIFLDAIKDRWGKLEKPKQLRLPLELAEIALKEDETR